MNFKIWIVVFISSFLFAQEELVDRESIHRISILEKKFNSLADHLIFFEQARAPNPIGSDEDTLVQSSSKLIIAPSNPNHQEIIDTIIDAANLGSYSLLFLAGHHFIESMADCFKVKIPNPFFNVFKNDPYNAYFMGIRVAMEREESRVLKKSISLWGESAEFGIRFIACYERFIEDQLSLYTKDLQGIPERLKMHLCADIESTEECSREEILKEEERAFLKKKRYFDNEFIRIKNIEKGRKQPKQTIKRVTMQEKTVVKPKKRQSKKEEDDDFLLKQFEQAQQTPEALFAQEIRERDFIKKLAEMINLYFDFVKRTIPEETIFLKWHELHSIEEFREKHPIEEASLVKEKEQSKKSGICLTPNYTKLHLSASIIRFDYEIRLKLEDYDKFEREFNQFVFDIIAKESSFIHVIDNVIAHHGMISQIFNLSDYKNFINLLQRIKDVVKITCAKKKGPLILIAEAGEEDLAIIYNRRTLMLALYIMISQSYVRETYNETLFTEEIMESNRKVIISSLDEWGDDSFYAAFVRHVTEGTLTYPWIKNLAKIKGILSVNEVTGCNQWIL